MDYEQVKALLYIWANTSGHPPLKYINAAAIAELKEINDSFAPKNSATQAIPSATETTDETDDDEGDDNE
jgi:hypothetical protein